MKTSFIFLFCGAATMPLSSCNGILEDIYDNPVYEQTLGDFGFIKFDSDSNSGTVYVDTSAYTDWVYIDFRNRETHTVSIADGCVAPSSWDIAIHRYDAKTNDGEVLETGFTGFDIMLSAGKIPEGTYIKDIWTNDRIAVDMSGMMEGNIKYAEDYYNPELSKWLNVDTSTMPPNYSMSKKVYVLKMKDGEYAALKLSNYMNSSGIKGYMTVDYIYPLEY